jgi:hypothetical protein
MNVHSKFGRTYKNLLVMLTTLPFFTLDSLAQENTAHGETQKAQAVFDYRFVREWVEKAKKAGSGLEPRELFKHIVLAPVLDTCFPQASEDQALHGLEGTIGNPADWDLEVVQREFSDLDSHNAWS